MVSYSVSHDEAVFTTGATGSPGATGDTGQIDNSTSSSTTSTTTQSLCGEQLKTQTLMHVYIFLRVKTCSYYVVRQ